MKNHHSFFKIAAAVFLLLIVQVSVPGKGYSQQNNPQLLALVECMKVKPENEDKYVSLEKEIWKPLHIERARQGNIVGWFLYRVRFTGTDDMYNYVTVTLFDSPLKVEDPWKNIDADKILPGKDLNKAMQETDESRELVSSALLNRQTFVYTEGGPGDFKYLQMDFMKVAPGKEGEYLDVENNVWKPVHNELIKAGKRVGWSLWGRIFPSGAELEYQFVTVNYFTDWSKIGTDNYNEAFAKAHPGKDVNDLSNRTNASRILAKSELWEVVDKAFAQ